MYNRKAIFGIVESVLLTLIVYFIFFYINPIRENFLFMNIQPLLIVVVAISLRYGNYIGVFSALLAILAYMYAYHSIGRDLYLFVIDFSYYKFLLMFFLSAVIFGRFKDDYDFKANNKKLEYDNLLASYDELLDGYEKLKFIKEELRKRVVGAEYSIVSLYEIASSLETHNSEEIYTEVINLLNKYIKATEISIYTVDESGKYLRLKIQHGHDELIPTSIEVENLECYQRITKTLKPSKIIDEEGCPLLVGPIIRDGKVIAVVNIDALEFEMVTDYSFNIFKVIVDWVTKALIQAYEVEEMKKDRNYFKNTKIMKYENYLNPAFPN
ncbi:MAG: hypothetical protein U9Q80_06320 [Bacillota bacterium]|nr:hypothetical protein [Bacillota bacterium]